MAKKLQEKGVNQKIRMKINKSFCGGSRGVVFSKRTPLAAGGKKLFTWIARGCNALSDNVGLKSRLNNCGDGCDTLPDVHKRRQCERL